MPPLCVTFHFANDSSIGGGVGVGLRIRIEPDYMRGLCRSRKRPLVAGEGRPLQRPRLERREHQVTVRFRKESVVPTNANILPGVKLLASDENSFSEPRKKSGATE